MEHAQKLSGYVRRWYDTWGIVYCYSGTTTLTKYFLHILYLLEGSETPKPGSKVMFTPAPPRSGNEMPMAVEVEVIDVEPVASPAPVSEGVDDGTR